MPIVPSNVKALPPIHCNSPPSITEQSTERKVIEKRKRITTKEEVVPPKKMEKVKKIKLSPTSKNSKLCIINTSNETLTIQEIYTPKSIIKSESATEVLDVVKTYTTNHVVLSKDNFGPTSFQEMLNMSNNDKENGQLKTSIDISINAPMILEHTIEGVGNNADDIHVTCEGFPMEDFSEPLEMSESSTSKLKKDENNSKLMIVQNGISESNEPIDLKTTKTSLINDQNLTSKAKRNTKAKNSNIVLKKPTTRKPTKCIVSNKNQNKNKKVKNTRAKVEKLDTSNSHDSQKNCEDSNINEQKPCKSLLITTESPTTHETLKNEDLLKVESIKVRPTSIDIKDVFSTIFDKTHHTQTLESTCKVS